jgi:hypothetical protein
MLASNINRIENREVFEYADIGVGFRPGAISAASF